MNDQNDDLTYVVSLPMLTELLGLSQSTVAHAFGTLVARGYVQPRSEFVLLQTYILTLSGVRKLLVRLGVSEESRTSVIAALLEGVATKLDAPLDHYRGLREFAAWLGCTRQRAHDFIRDGRVTPARVPRHAEDKEFRYLLIYVGPPGTLCPGREWMISYRPPGRPSLQPIKE